MYTDDTLYTDRAGGAEAHVAYLVGQLRQAAGLLATLRRARAVLVASPAAPNRDERLAKLDLIVEREETRIERLVPTAPIEGLRVLGNAGDVGRPSDDTPVGAQLVKRASGWVIVGADGAEAEAAGDFVFVFVVPVPSPRILLGERRTGGHTVASLGADVYYAGELSLSGGRLIEWSNDSGHYRTPESQNPVIGALGLDDVLPASLWKPQK